MKHHATHIGRAFEAILAAYAEENAPKSMKTKLSTAMYELADLMIELGADERRMLRALEKYCGGPRLNTRVILEGER